MWGGVGRGKSFLMDAFYATVPVRRKTRLHFHEFMRGVHRELEEVKGKQDPLDELAAALAKRYRLICFDEFHVSDVADAMILHRLLLKLFENGTSFVMTSNYEPATLYPTACTATACCPPSLIQPRMDVMNVDARGVVSAMPRPRRASRPGRANDGIARPPARHRRARHRRLRS